MSSKSSVSGADDGGWVRSPQFPAFNSEFDVVDPSSHFSLKEFHPYPSHPAVTEPQSRPQGIDEQKVVGDLVGDRVGLMLGIAVGKDCVGKTVGNEELGNSEGPVLGILLGAKDGTDVVGEIVGAIDGADEDGSPVGKPDGAELVGIELGTSEGKLVGINEGWALGDMVG